MSFKQGEIVAYPNSVLMMQVASDSFDDTTFCVILHNKRKHLIQLPSEELVRASIH